jgi:Cytochrome c7 and related cytochrome c
VLAALVLAGVSLGWLVTSPPVTGQEQVPIPELDPNVPPKPFHQTHMRKEKILCTTCHETAENPKPGQELRFSERPGHAACETCHAAEFSRRRLRPSATGEPVCKTCHTGDGIAVHPFPSGRLTLARFSHAQHVDPKAKLSGSGGRQDCIFCHRLDATLTTPSWPGHPQCGTCHGGARPARPLLTTKIQSIDSCLACHTLDRIDRNLSMQIAAANAPKPAAPANGTSKPRSGNGSSQLLPVSYPAPAGPHAYYDIRPFNHGTHLKSRNGAPIDCASCHEATLGSRTIDVPTPRPTMRQCASCHDNATFVRAEYLTKNCEVCHTTLRADIRPRAGDPVPPSIIHTEGFRQHHEEQARDPDSQCGVCHRSFVNASQNKCAGCHSSMQPRSHAMLRWADWPHGRQAALDRKTCTTCHTGDFCIACHNVPPRSHVPLQIFRLGAHRDLAALNLRSCFTCHTFESTCARCHRKQVR